MPVRATDSQFAILAAKTPEISTINAGTGSKEPSIMMMEAVLLMILNFYGVSWSSEQIRETAEMVIDECWWLQIAELKHFLTRVKMGEYGKLLSAGQLTPPILMRWLGQYADESWRIRAENGFVAAQSDNVDERTESRETRYEAAKESDYQAEKIKQMQRELTQKMTKENERHSE